VVAPDSTSQADQQLIVAALAREGPALRVLVERLTPEVQSAVARALLKGRRPGASIRQEVEDLTQDVFVALFDKQGATLRRWDPAEGLDLNRFVRMAARRLVISRLRNRPRNPFHNKVQDPSDFEQTLTTEATADSALGSRRELSRLLAQLEQELSPLGFEMFWRLFAEEQTVEVVCQETGLSAEAIYQWRSRLRKQVQALAGERLQA
jgi:RNA polymerase sigma factor (sigma-70 family)